MNFFERYLGDTYELVDTLKNSERSFVAVVYDKRAKRLCTMKRRDLHSMPIYQTLKELDNPHVPQIYRLFERDGKLIIVEEHIDGQTLEELLIYRPDELNEPLAEKILLQLCECLNVLHAKNIIHRDLKPSNIMLTEKNIVKLIDFGIARIFKAGNSSDTELLGTRGYAPPEQFGLFDFGQTDSRSDIYALGITIKNLLGENYNGRLKKFLDKCTALEPSQRFQSAEELRRAILYKEPPRKSWKIFLLFTVVIGIYFFANNFPADEEKIAAPVEVPKSEEKISAPVEVTKSEEKISAPVETPKSEEKISAPVEVTQSEEKIFDMPTLPQTSLPELNLPPTAPLPEINRPQPRQEEKSSGEVEMKLFLNGEPTNKEHMVYLRNWQNWERGKHKEYFFPNDWHARLQVMNYSGKALINPRIKVHVGYREDDFFVDEPTIENGQVFYLDIPLGGKMASPRKGRGNLQIVLKAEGEPEIFLNKTFFLVE